MVSATPSSRTVGAGTQTSYTATIAALNGFSGSVGLSVSGTTGSDRGFQPEHGSRQRKFISAEHHRRGCPGRLSIHHHGDRRSLSHTVSITLVVTAAVGSGTLAGSMASPAGAIQLTTEGSSDWAHWGLNVAADFDPRPPWRSRLVTIRWWEPQVPHATRTTRSGSRGRMASLRPPPPTARLASSYPGRTTVSGLRYRRTLPCGRSRFTWGVARTGTAGGAPERWQRGGLCGHVIKQQCGGDDSGSLHADLQGCLRRTDPDPYLYPEHGRRRQCDNSGRYVAITAIASATRPSQ